MSDLCEFANSDRTGPKPQWLELQRAALADSEDDKIESMVQEMARTKVNLPIVRRVVKDGEFVFIGSGQVKKTKLTAGQYVVLDLVSPCSCYVPSVCSSAVFPRTDTCNFEHRTLPPPQPVGMMNTP